ncbi:hypothetical protein RHSP_61432 [Rhizobium freirei PRF 81]|uniref:Uncharacterized protein n=1 Tax=Rhizobium freirei PRF 81 TaxID=363754 RepID=N6UDM6_9HYPH|nr:hypothetical protein [Rhizobium freirei]ENN88268.1 hypothetical protein RHSP_61432 [Rhizobium freirei PRF 81]
MSGKHTNASDQPLTSVDLDLCQRAFDSALFELNIDKESEEAGRVAALIIRLFQQGVSNERHLTALVSASRGRLYHMSL